MFCRNSNKNAGYVCVVIACISLFVFTHTGNQETLVNAFFVFIAACLIGTRYFKKARYDW
jgi:hypothetical protein